MVVALEIKANDFYLLGITQGMFDFCSTIFCKDSTSTQFPSVNSFLRYLARIIWDCFASIRLISRLLPLIFGITIESYAVV